MKTTGFIFAALLGLGLSSSALAQTVPVVPGTATTPGAPGAVVPGQPGTTSGTMPTSTVPGTMTTPTGMAAPVGTMPGTVYSPGTTTAPNGALNGTQPVGTSPVVPGTMGTMRRTTTGSRTTNTTKTVRP